MKFLEIYLGPKYCIYTKMGYSEHTLNYIILKGLSFGIAMYYDSLLFL